MPDAKTLAPVALFVYNRPDHTLTTLNALTKNDLASQTHLYVFSDGPRPGRNEEAVISEVREIVCQGLWCGKVTVVTQEHNLGLATSIRQGIDSLLKDHDRVIVLEDDIATAPGFLRYMNDALILYADDDRVMNVSGYIPSTSYQWMLPETFFLRHMSWWGWATWRRAWQQAIWDASRALQSISAMPSGIHRFDLEGRYEYSRQLRQNLDGSLSTWAIFWLSSIYIAGGFSLFPRQSLVSNTGFDGTGEHCSPNDHGGHNVHLAENIAVVPVAVRESLRGRFYLKSFFQYGRDASVTHRLWRVAGRAKHKLASVIRRWVA